MLSKFTSRMFAPADIASRVVLRVLFGAIMLWEVCRYFEKEWIFRYYIEPTFFFTYYGFDWVRPWPGNGMYIHFAVLGVLAIFVLLGFLYCISTVLFFLGFTYIFLLDQANYLNHFYFVVLMSFLMILTPAHRTASIDAWTRPKIRIDDAPIWTLWLLQAQVGVVYFYAGVAKINEDFMSGEPLRSWLRERNDYTFLGGMIPVGKLFTQEWFIYFMSYGGLFFDLLVVPGLLWRRTRFIAFGFAVLFHLMNVKLFSIGIFPWFAMAVTTLFFSPGWPRRIFNWPRRTPIPPQATGVVTNPNELAPSLRMRRWVIGFCAVYMTIQVLMPLRHFLYPGSVHWTEEGHNFSWHMKLRDKEARATFEIHDPQTGETWTPRLRQYLSKRQVEKMSRRPDMILKFAHHLAKMKREELGRDVEVRANVVAQLNARPEQLLIDPTVDLAKVKASLLPAKWIKPLE